MDKNTSNIISKKLNSDKLKVIDVGAKGGMFSLNKLNNFTDYIGFEPNPNEISKLSNKKNTQYFPYIISDTNSDRELFITRNPSFSSLLKLNERTFDKHLHLMKDFSKIKKGFEIKETITVPSRTLETVIDSENLSFIDFLKLDTQGTELEILKGSIDKLVDKKIGVIYAEVTFIEAYKKQNLFSDLDIFLRTLDYEFVDCRFYPDKFQKINSMFFSKIIEHPKYSLGGDAVFVPNIELVDLTPNQCFRIGLVLASLKYYSISHNFLKKSNLTDNEIKKIFKLYYKFSFKSFLKDMIPPILIKLIKTVIK